MTGSPERPKRTSVGHRVRALRRKLGMTQAELAGDRYSAAYISTVETERRTPSRALLEYIAPRLGVDVGDLSGDDSAAWVIEMARDLRSGGRTRAARALLERSLTNLEQSGQLAPGVLVALHRELARGAGPRKVGDAEHHLQLAVDYAAREGVARIELAVTLIELADVHVRRGRHQVAAGEYRRAAGLILDLFGRPLDDAGSHDE